MATIRGPWARKALAVLILTVALPGLAFAQIEGTNFSDTIPANEIDVDGLLPSVSSFDTQGSAFGSAAGEVCTLGLEDFTLRSQRSANGGVTFSPEIDVAGGQGAGAVKDYSAAQAADESIYVAMAVVRSGGDIGLSVARSTDMCQTWSAPVNVIDTADASHGLRGLEIAAGSALVSAVVYAGAEGGDPYAVATDDGGLTWSSPVRLDAGTTQGAFMSLDEDIAIDPANDNIYVTFLQDRGAGASVFTTRSTNLGVSFSSEVQVTVPGGHAVSANPTLSMASDGSVLLGFWDSFGNNSINVGRSTDAGQTYPVTLQRTLLNATVEVPILVATHSATSTVLAIYISELGEFRSVRSTNNGASWDAGQTLGSNVAGEPNGRRPYSNIAYARTASGNWVVGWSDTRDDGYAGFYTDVYVRASTNDGASWAAEDRADTDVAGSQTSWISAIAPSGSDDVFVLWEESRDSSGRSVNWFGNAGTAASLSFGTDYRIDSDAGTATPRALVEPAVATDGAGNVYVAFSAFGTGPESDIYVSRSDDGGYTFGTPVRVGDTAAGSRIEATPLIEATADGNVYVVYTSDHPSNGRELRFNRSADFGASWNASDTLLDDDLAQVPAYFTEFSWPAPDMEAQNGGTVYVAWSNQTDVQFARSFDAGANFDIDDIDQNTSGFNRIPRFCTNGNQVIMSWWGTNLAQTAASTWGMVSTDQGANWGPRTQLRPEGIAGRSDPTAIACDGTDSAVVVWPDLRGSQARMWSNRFNGTSWAGNVQLTWSLGSAEHALPLVTFAGGSNVVVAFEDFAGGEIFASRSTDGGASFPTNPTQLDAAAPESGAFSSLPRLASDGASNVWVSWLDESAGLPAVVARYSDDGGASYGPVTRMEQTLPQGGFANSYFVFGSDPVAVSGEAYFVWGAERETFAENVVFNAWDTGDFDRDGSPAGTDCDDNDPAVTDGAANVTGVMLAKIPGARHRLRCGPRRPAGSDPQRLHHRKLPVHRRDRHQLRRDHPGRSGAG